MCNFCKDAERFISTYMRMKKTFSEEQIDDINKIRDELCKEKQKCNCENCIANKLIELLDKKLKNKKFRRK